MRTTFLQKKKYLPYIFSLIVVINSFTVFAQDEDPLLDDTESVLNSEQIDVDGTFRRKTAADRIEEMRKKLEQQNEEMVDRKIENIRMQEEQKLTKKLQQAFDGQMQALDEQPVAVQQAAPVPAPVVAPVVIAPPPVIEEKKEEPAMVKVIPSFGVTSISSDVVDYETKLNLGLSLDTMLSKYFALGVKFNYSSMSLTEGNQSPFGINYNNPTYLPYYGYDYAQHYSNGREINYKQMAFGLNGRVFMAANSKIKPYLGLGLSYNRVSLDYNNEEYSPYSYNSIYYGDEGYSSSYVSTSLAVGSEISFNEMIGMLLEVSYTRALSSGFYAKSDAQSGYKNPDQVKLEKYGQDIEGANFITLGAGFVIGF